MKDIEKLNAMFSEYEAALDAAATAQKDVVVIMRLHLHEEGSLPTQQMQAAANDLWYNAAQKKEELERFFMQHIANSDIATSILTKHVA